MCIQAPFATKWLWETARDCTRILWVYWPSAKLILLAEEDAIIDLISGQDGEILLFRETNDFVNDNRNGYYDPWWSCFMASHENVSRQFVFFS